MPSTPHTFARTRIKLTAISLLTGTVLSIAVAMVGPVVLPPGGKWWHAGYSANKTVSWLTTIYSDSYPDRKLTTLDQIAKTHERTFSDDTREYLHAIRASTPAPAYGDVRIMESGFPCRSFSAWKIHFYSWDIAQEDDPPISLGMLALNPDKSDPIEARWIPLNPIWPGLLANAAVWSLAIALPLFAWTEGRRMLRRRRNRCVACAYSRAGLDPATNCPECGSAAALTASGIMSLQPRGTP